MIARIIHLPWSFLVVAILASLFHPALSALCRADISIGPTRYGPLNLFDHRSKYGQGGFPEPFLVDDSDLEVQEIRLDWSHQQGKGMVSDKMKAELEKGFGLATFELGAHYQRDTQSSFNRATHQSDRSRDEGIANIDLGIRSPLFQFVSNNGFIDNTFGAAFELGIPTNSPVSKHAEIVPKLFNDLRLGNHFTFQTILGYSFLLGSNPEGGAESFEYGLDFGWTIRHAELPIPRVLQLTPMLELTGETALNKDNPGHNALTAVAALRFNLTPLGPIQPRLGVGYVFPIDKGARDTFEWGIVTSLVFEF